MNEATQAAVLMIERMKEKITKAETELMNRKRLANALAAEEGLPIVYEIGEVDVIESISATSIRFDQFTGLGLATAVRRVLGLRQKSGKEKTASSEELYADLMRGGYDFETKDKDAAIHKLRTSLGKNPIFKGIGQTGRYGLTEWYGAPKTRFKLIAPIQSETASKSGFGIAEEALVEEMTGQRPPDDDDYPVRSH